MRHLLRPLLLLALPLALAACGDDPSGPETDGTYALVSVNGNPLPALLFEERGEGFHIQVNVKGGELVLNDGRFDAELRLQAFLNGQPLDDPEFSEPVSGTGTYVIDGSTITFRDAGEGTTTTGRIEGDTITLSDTDEEFGTVTMVFRK